MAQEEKIERPEAWYVLVCNLPLAANEFDIGSGIKIRSLRAPLTVFDLAAAGAVGFREWATLEPLAPIATAEIYSPIKEATMPGYDALNKCWLVSALLSLRGFSLHLCPAVSAYSWNFIAGHQAQTSKIFRQQLKEEDVESAVFKPRGSLPPFQGSLLDYHLKLLTQRHNRDTPFDAAEAKWFLIYLERFNILAAEDERFRFALEAAVDWRYAKDCRAAIARLWGGIEAIFGINSELVHRISLLAACALAPRGTGRLKSYKLVKEIYNIRSKAVHGEPLTDERMQRGLHESFEILKVILFDAVESGKIRTEEDYLQELLC